MASAARKFGLRADQDERKELYERDTQGTIVPQSETSDNSD